MSSKFTKRSSTRAHDIKGKACLPASHSMKRTPFVSQTLEPERLDTSLSHRWHNPIPSARVRQVARLCTGPDSRGTDRSFWSPSQEAGKNFPAPWVPFVSLLFKSRSDTSRDYRWGPQGLVLGALLGHRERGQEGISGCPGIGPGNLSVVLGKPVR